MSLTQKTARGVMWTGTSTSANTLLNFIILALLARLLSPSDFGLMGIVTIVISFAVMLSDLGLGAAIIQKQNVTEEQLSTFFFLNIIIGCIICIICYSSADYLALFFKNDKLVSLLKFISFSFIIISLGQVFRPLLQKEMKFASLFRIDILALIISGVSSIGFAFMGFGVWSLIYGFIIKSFIQIILYWHESSFKPKAVFRPRDIKESINFGGYVLGERIINYFNRNLDNIIIGRYLGAYELGFYSLAYNIMLFPVSRIASSVTAVTFPAFSIVQRDNRKIREAYLKVIKYISLITFPLMAGLLVVAREFIISIYGNKWQPAITVLQILCIVGAIQSIVTTVGSVQYAKGRSDIGFKWSCFAVCCYAVVFFVGIKWGIVGVAIGYAVADILLSPIIQGITNKLIDLNWGTFLKQLKSQFWGSVLIVSGILILKSFLLNRVIKSNSAILILSVIIGSLIYGLLIILRERKAIKEALEIFGWRYKTINNE